MTWPTVKRASASPLSVTCGCPVSCSTMWEPQTYPHEERARVRMFLWFSWMGLYSKIQRPNSCVPVSSLKAFQTYVYSNLIFNFISFIVTWANFRSNNIKHLINYTWARCLHQQPSVDLHIQVKSALTEQIVNIGCCFLIRDHPIKRIGSFCSNWAEFCLH